jgi:S-formylglutathione hydrolase FrmB
LDNGGSRARATDGAAPPSLVDAGERAVAEAGIGDAACTTATFGGPKTAPYPVVIGDQKAWSHDDGFNAGYFHTYDALDVGGAGDLPHKVHVFLPRNYDACDRGYPVVYMNDGQTAFWTGGSVAQSWRVAEALDAGYKSGKIPKLIVVAIVPNDREYEYSYAQATPGAACCGADRYTSYVADRIRGFVDTTYRTLRGPKNTAIVGSSRGGLSAFYLATRRPDVFGKAACLSPSFWAGLDPVYGGTLPGGPLEGSGLVVPVTSTLADATVRPRLWIDWGLVRTGGFGNDTIEAAATLRGREMVGLLKTKYGYVEPNLNWEEDPMGGHDEGSWSRRLPRVLEALFR